MNRKIRFRISGLVSAGLCQKSNKTFSSVASEWNNLNSDLRNAIEVNIAINHYPGTAFTSTVNVLLETEPTPTWPFNRKPWHSRYDLRFAARATSSDVRCLAWFNEPTEGAYELSPLDVRRPKFTMIAADKFSAVSGELYSLRRRLAGEFRDEIDLFGPEWDFQLSKRAKRVLGELVLALKAGAKLRLGHTLNYLAMRVISHGPIRDKFEGYRRNRFALVVENSMELRTEKLYDAIESGCIPVYVGPACEDGIPEGLYLRAKPTFEDVASAMKAVKEVDLKNWGNLRLGWMESDSYRLTAEARFWGFLDDLSKELENAQRN